MHCGLKRGAVDMRPSHAHPATSATLTVFPPQQAYCVRIEVQLWVRHWQQQHCSHMWCAEGQGLHCTGAKAAMLLQTPLLSVHEPWRTLQVLRWPIVCLPWPHAYLAPCHRYQAHFC